MPLLSPLRLSGCSDSCLARPFAVPHFDLVRWWSIPFSYRPFTAIHIYTHIYTALPILDDDTRPLYIFLIQRLVIDTACEDQLSHSWLILVNLHFNWSRLLTKHVPSPSPSIRDKKQQKQPTTTLIVLSLNLRPLPPSFLLPPHPRYPYIIAPHRYSLSFLLAHFIDGPFFPAMQ